jgi:RNA polymerase sigma-70 factor (ECF subfamily)
MNTTNNQTYNEDSFSSTIIELKDKTHALLTRRFPNANSQDIEDAVQIANIRSHKFYDKFRGGSTFATWYTKIAMNALLDILKKKSNQHLLYGMISDILCEKNGSCSSDPIDMLVTEHQPGPDHIISEEERLAEIRESIREGVSTLKEKQAKVFDLIFLQEKSYKDAASELNIPIGTVMSQVHTIRKTLQNSITQRSNLVAA